MSIVQQTIFRQELVQSTPYVSTDLRMTELTTPEAVRQDMMLEGIWYRRLDAQYFVWIERQVELARRIAKQGKITKPALDALLYRFQDVKEWVDENLGDVKLQAARKLFDPAAYAPPPAAQPVSGTKESPPAPSSSTAPHLYPADGDWKFTRPVPHEVVAQVDVIRDKALALGWSEARLYQNRGNIKYPCGQDWGLVCILDSGQTIGEVAREYIEIFTSSGVRQRFINFDVDQPWIRKVKIKDNGK